MIWIWRVGKQNTKKKWGFKEKCLEWLINIICDLKYGERKSAAGDLVVARTEEEAQRDYLTRLHPQSSLQVSRTLARNQKGVQGNVGRVENEEGVIWMAKEKIQSIAEDLINAPDGQCCRIVAKEVLKDVIKNSEIVIDKGYSENNVHHQYYHLPVLKMRELKKKYIKLVKKWSYDCYWTNGNP